MLLQHLYLGLRKDTAHYLDIASGGSFLHLSTRGGRAVLNKILENTPYTGIHDEFPEEEDGKPQEVETLEAESPTPNPSKPSSSPPRPASKTLKEEEDPPLKFPFEIEDNLFEDF